MMPLKFAGILNSYGAPFAKVPLQVSTPAVVVHTDVEAADADGAVTKPSVTTNAAALIVAIDLRIVISFM